MGPSNHLHKESELAGERAELFIKMNNTRINSSEIALSIIGMSCHITGSRSEGVHQGDSDTDILIYGNDIEAVMDEQTVDKDKVFIHIENTCAHPGYAMLKVNVTDLGRDIELLEFLKQPMEFVCNTVHGLHYLSTHKVVSAMSIYAAFKLPWTGGTLKLEENSGPAKHVTIEMGNKKHDLDILYTIQFKQCTQHLVEWQKRHRGWPEESLVDELLNLPIFLVPLGHPLCHDDIKDSQWKFSFNLQERTLMRNLKGSQIICCNMLKVLRQHLKELHDTTKGDSGVVLKSYYFKTCFLWTIEKMAESDWSEQNIIQKAIKCVQYLIECLKKKQCPHYFIPENNLFEGKDIIAMDTSNVEKFLISICVEDHPLWQEMLDKVLVIYNKTYMQKQPMLNCVSTCRHLIVLSIKNIQPEEALEKVLKRYKQIEAIEIKEGLCDKDWRNSILMTLKSVLGMLSCTLHLKEEICQKEEGRILETCQLNKQNYLHQSQDMDNQNGIIGITSDIHERVGNTGDPKNTLENISHPLYSWNDVLHEGSQMDFCSGKLKEATVKYYFKDYEKAKEVTTVVIERDGVNMMHHTGFHHVRDDTFTDEENSRKDWSNLVQNHVIFDVLFIPAEAEICLPAIQLELCEGRGLMVNPLVYAYYLHFCIMQQNKATKQDLQNILQKWQKLLNEKKKAGYNYLDWEIISFCYQTLGEYKQSLHNLLRGGNLRDTGSAHYWLLALLIYRLYTEMKN